MLGIFPIFHAAGFTVLMNLSIFGGFEVILVPRPEAGGILEMTRKLRPNIFTCVPTIFVGALNHLHFPKTEGQEALWNRMMPSSLEPEMGA